MYSTIKSNTNKFDMIGMVMNTNEIQCACDITHPEAIKHVQEKMLDDKTIDKLSAVFQMFAHKTRAKILISLSTEELCVCDIAAVMNMSKSAVSHQLALLKKSNLVKNRRDGKNVYYSLDDEHVQKIIEMGLDHILER